MAARRSRRSFSTWRAGAARRARRPRARPPSERARHARDRLCAASGGRDGAALSVPVALVVAARARARLLADDAAVRVGIPAALHLAERRLLRARRRDVHRGGAVVGYPVPRAARIFGVVSRGGVGGKPP